jgi:hypothetical protein
MLQCNHAFCHPYRYSFVPPYTPTPQTPIAAVTFELWTTQSGYTFDNLLLTDNEAEAAEVAATTWTVKRAAQDLADVDDSFFGVRCPPLHHGFCHQALDYAMMLLV